VLSTASTKPGSAADEIRLAQAKIVADWQRSGVGAKQVAATLALEFQRVPKRTPVESATQIASRFGTSTSMAVRARKLLLDTGFITRSDTDRHYYVT
jgi:hypothetical protein